MPRTLPLAAALLLFTAPAAAFQCVPFSHADDNGDGVVSRSEAQDYHSRSFQQLDSDGDGTIGQGEYNEAFNGIYDPIDADNNDEIDPNEYAVSCGFGK